MWHDRCPTKAKECELCGQWNWADLLLQQEVAVVQERIIYHLVVFKTIICFYVEVKTVLVNFDLTSVCLFFPWRKNEQTLSCAEQGWITNRTKWEIAAGPPEVPGPWKLLGYYMSTGLWKFNWVCLWICSMTPTDTIMALKHVLRYYLSPFLKKFPVCQNLVLILLLFLILYFYTHAAIQQNSMIVKTRGLTSDPAACCCPSSH